MNNKIKTLILSMVMSAVGAGNVTHAAEVYGISPEIRLYIPLLINIQQGNAKGVAKYRTTFVNQGNPNWTDSDGHTLFWHAEQSQNAEIISLLQEFKVAANNPNNISEKKKLKLAQ